ncbi:hypothetical protein [Candidatus Ferrigenium straubiae]|jgi:hypothetical protein
MSLGQGDIAGWLGFGSAKGLYPGLADVLGIIAAFGSNCTQCLLVL